MRKYISLFLIATVFSSVLLVPTAHAAGSSCGGSFLGIPPWHDGLCKDGKVQVDRGKDGIANGITRIALNVFGIILYVISYIAVAMVIFGGIKYVISTGDPTKATAARQTIQNALIGLLLGLSALAIVNFVSERIG